MTKKRTEIPRAVAAEVLFLSNRVCCVCRASGKPVQIHHIDEDPTNHDVRNLAVLCFDCHRETQLRGGFDRKLDADQVRLYRDDWREHVKRGRQSEPGRDPLEGVTEEDDRLQLTAALIEVYKEEGDLLALARLHGQLGNTDLRDRYVEEALARPHEAWEEVNYRRLQGRMDLLPPEVRDAAVVDVEDDWTVRAAMLEEFGDIYDAVRTYMDGIREALDQDRPFLAAFYLRYGLDDRIVESVFKKALQQAVERADLWWELRSYEELGWTTEWTATLRAHADEINASGDLLLQRKLAEALGDHDGARELAIAIAREEARAYKELDEVEPEATAAAHENLK